MQGHQHPAVVHSCCFTPECQPRLASAVSQTAQLVIVGFIFHAGSRTMQSEHPLGAALTVVKHVRHTSSKMGSRGLLRCRCHLSVLCSDLLLVTQRFHVIGAVQSQHVSKLACMWRRRCVVVAAVCVLLCISRCDALPPCIDQRSQQTALQVTADCSWTGAAAADLTVSGELHPFLRGAFAIVRNATAVDASAGAVGSITASMHSMKTAPGSPGLLLAAVIHSSMQQQTSSSHKECLMPHSLYLLRRYQI